MPCLSQIRKAEKNQKLVKLYLSFMEFFFAFPELTEIETFVLHLSVSFFQAVKGSDPLDRLPDPKKYADPRIWIKES